MPAPDQYTTSSTSRSTARVEDRVLSESTTTRKVLRAELIENPKDPEAAVRIAIIHQRKKSHEEWEDIPAEPLSKLKAGEQAKMTLDTQATLRLYQELGNLSEIFKKDGITWGTREVVVADIDSVLTVPANRRQAIQALLEQGHSEEVWQDLVEREPDLATRLSNARLHEERSRALQEFAESLDPGHGESYWQDFFKRNTWIFGYGLQYQFLDTIESQPHYGGTAFTGRGGQRGDYLTATAADVRFTVLVEIKKPDTDLLCDEQYRNGVHAPSDELAGGVSQLQVNCRKWEVEGSRLEQNVETLGEEDIFTVSPRGILVIGNTDQLIDSHRRNSFELFRRSVVNPEILTFDELYQRARYIVEQTSPEEGAEESAEQSEADSDVPGDDAIPF